MKNSNDLSSSEFVDLLDPFSQHLLELSDIAEHSGTKNEWLTPLLIGEILSYSTRLEEFVDYCGAKRSRRWFPWRESIAAIKLFSNVCYIFLHIRSSSPHYQLLGNIESFLSETDENLERLTGALTRSLESFSSMGRKLGLPLRKDYYKADFRSRMPDRKLKNDRSKVKVKDPGTVIVNMATSFLNLFTEAEIMDLSEEDPDKFTGYIPDQIDEASLRSLEMHFHNLQSVYDTRLSHTNIESLDPRLPLIRGHASIVYHLLQAATELIHYYERHMAHNAEHLSEYKAPLRVEEHLGIVFGYCLKYAGSFLVTSISICREVISSYAENGEVKVPVPNYRGFHVRPSTLVAKIVRHYGSNVVLEMGDLECNANLPLELFRVNEQINAEKRKSVSSIVGNMKLAELNRDPGNIREMAVAVIHDLEEQKKIISYDINLEIPDLQKSPDESPAEYINRVIAQMLAEGRIDIRTDLSVIFKGDKRVLHDLQILAECGYGEDSFGNNIILPKELSYLKR